MVEVLAGRRGGNLVDRVGRVNHRRDERVFQIRIRIPCDLVHRGVHHEALCVVASYHQALAHRGVSQAVLHDVPEVEGASHHAQEARGSVVEEASLLVAEVDDEGASRHAQEDHGSVVEGAILLVVEMDDEGAWSVGHLSWEEVGNDRLEGACEGASSSEVE